MRVRHVFDLALAGRGLMERTSAWALRVGKPVAQCHCVMSREISGWRCHNKDVTSMNLDS